MKGINVLDIILIIPLIWALVSGFREGIIVQLGGIAGLLIGVWLAFHYSTSLGHLLNIDPAVDKIIGFILIFMATLICMALIGRLLSGLCRFAGMAVLDRFGGSVLSVLKGGLVLGLLVCAFSCLNRTQNWVDQHKLESALLYKPVTGIVDLVFPYIDTLVKNKILTDNPEQAHTLCGSTKGTRLDE